MSFEIAVPEGVAASTITGRVDAAVAEPKELLDKIVLEVVADADLQAALEATGGSLAELLAVRGALR